MMYYQRKLLPDSRHFGALLGSKLEGIVYRMDVVNAKYQSEKQVKPTFLYLLSSDRDVDVAFFVIGFHLQSILIL